MRFIFIGIMILISGCTSAEKEQIPASPVIADVEQFIYNYQQAITTLDTVIIRQSISDDGRFQWLEDGQLQYRSADDVINSLSALPPEMEFTTDYRSSNILFAGATTVIYRSEFYSSIGSGDNAFTFEGMISMVIEHTRDGYKIISGHTSTKRDER